MRLVTRAELTGHKKWTRTMEALQAAPGLVEGVAYSIGDSLTYRKASTADLATPDFIGRRRYHMVVASMGSDVLVEVARKDALTSRGDYSDLTDREPFVGQGETVTVPDNHLLVVDIDEAARILPVPATEAVELHVTVEGATFHNK